MLTTILLITSLISVNSLSNQTDMNLEKYKEFVQKNEMILSKICHLWLNLSDKKIKNEINQKVYYNYFNTVEEKKEEIEKIKKEYFQLSVNNISKLINYLNKYKTNKNYEKIKFTQFYLKNLNENNLLNSFKEKYWEKLNKYILNIYVNQLKNNELENKLLNHWDFKNKLWNLYKLPLRKNEVKDVRKKVLLKNWYKNTYILLTWLKYNNQEILSWISFLNFIVKNKKFNSIMSQNNYRWIPVYNYMIKIPSKVWIRNLWSLYRPKWDFHSAFDITLENQIKDYKQNCILRYNQKVRDFKEKSKFDFNKYCIWSRINSDELKNFKNFKKDFNIFIKLNLNKLNKLWAKCYFWRNISKFNKYKLIWFWNFLMCWFWKKDLLWNYKYRLIMWHLDNYNYSYLNKAWALIKINKNSPKYVDLVWTMWWFYEKFYPNFDHKNFKFNWPSIWNYNFFPKGWNDEIYEININELLKKWINYLYLKYWSTWFSQANHIHFWLLTKSLNYTSPILNDEIYLNVLNKTFENLTWEKFSLDKNYYFYLWIK